MRAEPCSSRSTILRKRNRKYWPQIIACLFASLNASLQLDVCSINPSEIPNEKFPSNDNANPVCCVPKELSSTTNRVDMNKRLTTYFAWKEDGLSGEPEVPFNFSWIRYGSKEDLPTTLVPPDFLKVYAFNHSRVSVNMTVLANEVQDLVDNQLPRHGALLFRNMPLSAKAFAVFWNKISWPRFQRIDPFYDRFKLENIDLAPRAWPERLVPLHNEQTYNPISPEKVFFYCLEPAVSGGESIISRNVDLTSNIPQWVNGFIRDDGYVVYDLWTLFDGDLTDDPDKKAKSWQHKTGAVKRDDAIRSLVNYGFNESAITIDDQGTILLINNHTNFFFDDETQRLLWLNSISFDNAKRPNGERLPHELYQAVEVAEWKSSYAFKLQAGDLLVLDNMRVAHGRLPYINGQRNDRQLLTTYT